MKYCIYDSETNVRESYKRKANPFDPRNNIILSQKKYSDTGEIVLDYDAKGTRDPKIDWSRFDVIVGHNIKFDLEYFWKDPGLQAWLKAGGKIFDTMVAEFMITAQAHSYPSLNACAAKYGGTQKVDVCKEYWDAGFDTTDIPEDILKEYGKFDILNTELIMLSQLEQLSKLGLLKLFWGFMDGYAALIEMETNGLLMDQEIAARQKASYLTELSLIQALLKDMASKVLLKKEFNPNSSQQVKIVLQGGTYKYAERVQKTGPDGAPLIWGPKTKKAGQPQTRIETYETTVASEDALMPSTEVSSTDEESLVTLRAKKGISEDATTFIDLLLRSRKISKLISTYYDGLAEVIHKHDGLIHPTLDCVSAVTGRLNSKNPNAQNMPPSIRSIFKTRFEGGKIVEYDFSQLEVRIQAYLAQSDKMLQEIADGVDFHCKRLAYAEELSYDQVCKNLQDDPAVWGEKRKQIKTVSFQKAFQAGTKRIAEVSGLPIETVKQIFEKEDQDYPEIGFYNQTIQETLNHTRVPTEELLPITNFDTKAKYKIPGMMQGIGYYQGITGRRYHFLERGLEGKHGLRQAFSKQDIANYTVQGTANDVVFLSVGRVFRYLLEDDLTDKIKLINTVHDSLVIDFDMEAGTKPHPNNMPLFYIKDILQDVQGTMKGILGIDFNLPMVVDVSEGEFWE